MSIAALERILKEKETELDKAPEIYAAAIIVVYEEQDSRERKLNFFEILRQVQLILK